VTDTERNIQIGGVPFGVGVRLLAGLDDEPGVEVVRAVPVELVRGLRSGRFDAALVSSVEGFRRPGYRALGDIGIAARQPVRSVRAFFRTAPEDVRTVGLDAGSEASVALLRILLHGPLGARADLRFERIAPTRTPGALPHDVVMLIGDAGLEAEPGDRRPLDLAEAWIDWTGLPFVFALWLIGAGAPADRVAALLRTARERTRGQPRRANEGGVHYDLGAEERQGLERFRTEAVALGLAEPGVVPELLGNPAGGGA